MSKELIDGVMVRELRPIPDERGWLMEILRSDWEIFDEFGQVYMTSCYPGVVKGWHYHKMQDDHFACVRGMAKLVLYDSREGSPTFGRVNEFFMGERNFIMVKIPRLVYHGFKGIGDQEAWIINVPTNLYDYEEPDEFRLPHDSDEVPYDWDLRMG
ncbi:MAG: dTDP-4-dehydrorhamnose 3,5-epimerase family protein [Methanomassiliicoccales archaeon]